MKPAILAVGSSPLIANEICQLIKTLLNNNLSISTICTREVNTATKADFFICAHTQYAHLQQFIPCERIFVIDLTPTSSFFFQLAHLPYNQTIYIFNNQLAYTKILADYCCSIGLTHFHFLPIAYDEMKKKEVICRLQKAKYIIGVDCFVGKSVLLTNKYIKYLANDVKILAGKRTISIPSACGFLKGIADFYYSYAVQKRHIIFEQITKNMISSEILLDSANKFMQEISTVIAVLRTATIQAVANQVDLIATPNETKQSLSSVYIKNELTNFTSQFNQMTAILTTLKLLSNKLGQISTTR